MAVHKLEAIRPTPASAPLTAAPGPAPAPKAKKPRLTRTWLLIGLAVAGLGAAGGWWLLKPTVVNVGVVAVGEAVDAVYASGVVEYVRQAHVAPVVTAPIVRVLVAEGQDVRRGQTLAQLNDGPQVGTTLQLEAQAAQAQAVADRARRLLEAGFGARATDEDAQSQLKAARAAAGSARSRLADYRLTAPLAGRVLRRDAEPGDLATVSQPMFVIADLRSLRVTADVDERDVGRLAVGQDAVVRADGFPQQVFHARISQITPQGDSTGRVFRVRLSLAPDSPLKPGMTVETNLVTGRRPHAVLAPTAAISNGAVWVAVDGHARRRAVAIGAAGPDRTEIVRGATAGEQVIVNPPHDLKDGARIAVRARS